jgi:rubredoxin
LSSTAARFPAGEISIFNTDRVNVPGMSLEREYECPKCGHTGFWKTAAMELHLGTKTKWSCNECDYRFIEINGISTAEA